MWISPDSEMTPLAMFCMCLDQLELDYVAMQTDQGTWVLLGDGDVWHFKANGQACCHMSIVGGEICHSPT